MNTARTYEYGTGAAWGFTQSGNLETLAAILRYCDDPFSDEGSEYLTTPYTAIISGCRRRLDKKQSTDTHEAMLSMFLRRGYPMPAVLTECKTYLFHVPHMTRQLLNHGLDPNLPDWQRRTPLHDLCAGIRHVEIASELMQLFIDHGADIDAIDEEDRSTPLGIAARGTYRLIALEWRRPKCRRSKLGNAARLGRTPGAPENRGNVEDTRGCLD